MFKTILQMMDHNLSEAAEDGDINSLYAAISNDPFVLDNLSSIPFFDTPLHIAALGGQTHFALEIMMLKPSLGRKLNNSGYSPMHLASMNGHEELVRGLLSLDKDLVRVKGKEGKTPLHCLAITGGNSSLVETMLSVCPDSIEDLTLRRETSLHLAVKYNHTIVTFQVLVDCVQTLHREEIYSWQDEEGYTILHYATIRRQIEMIQLLFQKYRFKEWNLGVDVKDLIGRTALDIVEDFPATHEHRASIKDLLILGTLEGIVTPQMNEGISASNRYWGYIMHQLSLAVHQVPTNSRDALLVVLALINTTSFQVGVSPPGGFWQDDGETKNGKQYVAGTPILATTNPGLYFMISLFTMVGFISSLNLIYVLTMGMPMKYLLLVAVTFMTYSYLFAFIAITRELVWIILTTYGLVTLFIFVTSMIYVWKYMKRKVFPKLKKDSNL